MYLNKSFFYFCFYFCLLNYLLDYFLAALNQFLTKIFYLFCRLGFYWDITDWAGNIDNNNPDHHDGIVKEINYESPPLNDQSIDINIYNNSFYSNKAEFSPIYSKVFKSK